MDFCEECYVQQGSMKANRIDNQFIVFVFCAACVGCVLLFILYRLHGLWGIAIRGKCRKRG
jgi:hypothetical protein